MDTGLITVYYNGEWVKLPTPSEYNPTYTHIENSYRDVKGKLHRDIIRKDFCPSLMIEADQNEVIKTVMNQNFVPIVDGRGIFCGIITRKGVIESLAEQLGEK